MYMPRLESEQTRKDVQIEFKGYNHNLYVPENEFYDEQNMTSWSYPVLTPREKFWRYLNTEGETPADFGRLYDFLPPDDGEHQAVIIEDASTYEHPERKVVSYNGNPVGYIDVADDYTYIVEMGAYVVIFPHKVMFNRNEHNPALENLEASYTSQNVAYRGNTYGRTVGFWLVDSRGKALQNVTVSDTAPSNPAEGKYWVDTSGGSEGVEDHVLKRWSESMNTWVTQTTVYTRIYAQNLGSQFSPGDNITISGITDKNITLTHLNGDHIIHSCSPHGITIEALIDGRDYYVLDDDKSVTVERSVPYMEFVCEHENRLWGCDPSTNEIFASKLGDPKNWKSYGGISTDSYAVTVGSAGFFTGCASYGGAVNFFKPHEIIRITGTKPANFQTRTLDVPGLADGAFRSLCVIDETLYYVSEEGVHTFDGSVPRRISGNLGPYLLGGGGIRYIPEFGASGYTAQGGTDGRHYYLYTYMQDKHAGQDWTQGKYGLFDYDPETGIWSKIREYTPEENIWIRNFKKDPNHLNVFFMTDNDIYSVWNSMGYLVYNKITAVREENEIEWSAETGDIAYYDTNRRYISKIQIRTELEEGSELHVQLSYDHGAWEDAYTRTGPGERKTEVIPIIPHRCDTVRMRFWGTGMCKIFAVSKHYEQGSEI